MSNETHDRKIAHINIVREKNVEPVQGVFEKYSWPFKALPEVDLASIDVTTPFFDRTLSFPFIISSMTGGAALAEGINKNLAVAAEEMNVALGLGSMRIIIEHPEAVKSFAVRSLCPSIPLFANMGLVQLNYGYGADEINKIIEAVEADGIFLHVNPLQEAVQPEGNTNFHGLLKKLEAVIPKVTKPIIIKEVGTGIHKEMVKQLRDIGIEWIDVSGMGGTSWTAVEGHRREDRLGETFAQVGIETDRAIREAAEVDGINIIAGGGIRTGLDMAKACALGARLTTAAKPLLEPALESVEACLAELSMLKKEFETALFVAGCASHKDMSSITLH